MKINAAVEKDQKIDETPEENVLNEDLLNSGRSKRGVKLDLSAGLRFGWGGRRQRVHHKHVAPRYQLEKYHHGGRYGEEGRYDYHHDNFEDHYYYEDHYSYNDYHKHNHHTDHKHPHHDDYHAYPHY